MVFQINVLKKKSKYGGKMKNLVAMIIDNRMKLKRPERKPLYEQKEKMRWR